MIFILPTQIRSVVRRMELEWRKIINAEAAVSFNKIYIYEYTVDVSGLLPINTHKNNLYKPDLTLKKKKLTFIILNTVRKSFCL